jgi:hypothetical protein
MSGNVVVQVEGPSDRDRYLQVAKSLICSLERMCQVRLIMGMDRRSLLGMPLSAVLRHSC